MSEPAFTIPNPATWRNTRLQRCKPIEQRFWEKVNKNGPIPEHQPELGSCWMWHHLTEGHPYGMFKVKGKQVFPHRFSWELEHGKIPDGLGVCHICDRPGCVRGTHLFLGDQGVNVRDMFSKGRCIRHKGEKHAEAKLTDAQVFEIKKLINSGVKTKEIALKYGVVMGTIGHIKAGRNWTHIRM